MFQVKKRLFELHSLLVVLLTFLLSGNRLIECLVCDCNNKGRCTTYGTCKCYKGWKGLRCTKRICPTGPRLADIAYSSDAAHSVAECSGQGICDYGTGQCMCSPGFEGHNCGKFSCGNQCSGNGQCISLRAAANLYDGHRLNRTTVYNLWDADISLPTVPGWPPSRP